MNKAEYVAALRCMADVIERSGLDPDTYISRPIVNLFVADAEEMADLVRRIGGRFDKDTLGERTFFMRRDCAGGYIDVNASRENVCERVVTGTTKVTIPDPDFVMPEVPTVEVEVETFEWKCPDSILASAE